MNIPVTFAIYRVAIVCSLLVVLFVVGAGLAGRGPLGAMDAWVASAVHGLKRPARTVPS